MKSPVKIDLFGKTKQIAGSKITYMLKFKKSFFRSFLSPVIFGNYVLKIVQNLRSGQLKTCYYFLVLVFSLT